jgi:carbonic anhydrase
LSATAELVRNAEAYATTFNKAGLPIPPGLHVTVEACMDARVNPYGIFGLSEGDAHVIRNAGGAVTDDVIRSLAISQRLLGTEEIILVHHDDCGMRAFTSEELYRQIQTDTGIRPSWATEAFVDPAEDVRQSLARIQASPFLPKKVAVRGFVYDETTGELNEVTP